MTTASRRPWPQENPVG